METRTMTECEARLESGFTLIELLITTILMGIIGLVVSQTFLLAIKLGPETTERNKFANKTSFFTNALADEVANATAITAAGIFGPSNPDCKVPYMGTTGFYDLKSLTLPGTPTQSVRYFVLVDLVGATTSTYHVSVIRDFDADTTDPNNVVARTYPLDGYCTRNETGIFTVSYADPTYTLDLKIRPRPTQEARTITFTGDRRTLTPPP